MASLRGTVPSLHALIAFEAASRLLSFTGAAAELNVTQAAISRQIRELEQFLGVRLFNRDYRAISLTSAGVTLSSGTAAHLRALAILMEATRLGARASALVVGCTTAFASNWLFPRIPEFRGLYPNINLRFAVSDEVVDLGAEQIDVSIRWGSGNWQRVSKRFLAGSELIPVCHPQYWQSRNRPTQPADLISEHLLHLEGPSSAGGKWSDWFTAMGIEFAAERRGITVNNFHLMMQAALSGQGVALTGAPLADELLANRMLVPAIDAPLEAITYRVPGSYYIVTPEGMKSRSEATQFCDWITSRMRLEMSPKFSSLLHEP
ncbi:LysR substrate-binding domain-containing protein [Mesorhizobium tianshanense]|uniref:DNA-binding transcriptional LysR family regulator n=1 Tax=Mesorhizobium tianshanense TaxID=39844 RepID=A0A562N3X9_9HYPH|nr:LysR substrate-binding domain-containing protein [Mesorhizobium tianshanense]TWI26826.1 DNA-binding transcriptional LysR family regulator [Mesorhizobium tianshanense]